MSPTATRDRIESLAVTSRSRTGILSEGKVNAMNPYYPLVIVLYIVAALLQGNLGTF